jgi:cell shape-determining protein MreD
MNRARLLAAATAALTVLLLQATLVAPLTQPVPASLPAVLVAAVALVDGAGTGLAFGFVLGLLADLGSAHPAGVLALSWMAVGLACGTVAALHSVSRGALVAGCYCGLATLASGVLLAALGHTGTTLLGAIVGAVPAGALDGALALILVPVARRFLRSESLRRPHPVLTELALSAHD